MASQIDGQTLQSQGVQNLRVGTLNLDGTDITASAAESNAAADGSGNYIVTAATATAVTLTAAMSGKTILLPDFDGACTYDLPPEADGLNFKFKYVGGAEDAHGIIIDSESDTNYFVGGVLHQDVDADAAGIELVSVYSDGNSNSKFTATTIGAGSEIELLCTGTTWYISGTIAGVTVPAFADQ